MYTDTDSLIYVIYTDDIFEDYKKYKELWETFDGSDLPKDHPLYTTERKGQYGCFKDDTKGKLIKRAIALRVKMYAFEFVDNDMT